MGCAKSKTAEDMENKNSVVSTRPQPTDRIPLTQRQKQLVRDTWKILEADIAKVGVVTFLGLFEKYPELQDMFIRFKGKPLGELKNSELLRNHSLIVMNAVGKVITRLDEPQNLESMLHDLGKKHVSIELKIGFLDVIGPQIIQIIKSSMEDDWSAEKEEAWSEFFKMVASIMKESYLGIA